MTARLAAAGCSWATYCSGGCDGAVEGSAPVVSSPPPLVSSPPPLVSSPPPLVSSPPPLVSSPPPVVQSPPPLVSSPPPVVQSPPPLVSSPPPLVSSPPPATAPGASGLTPLGGGGRVGALGARRPALRCLWPGSGAAAADRTRCQRARFACTFRSQAPPGPPPSPPAPPPRPQAPSTRAASAPAWCVHTALDGWPRAQDVRSRWGRAPGGATRLRRSIPDPPCAPALLHNHAPQTAVLRPSCFACPPALGTAFQGVAWACPSTCGNPNIVGLTAASADSCVACLRLTAPSNCQNCLTAAVNLATRFPGQDISAQRNACYACYQVRGRCVRARLASTERVKRARLCGRGLAETGRPAGHRSSSREDQLGCGPGTA